MHHTDTSSAISANAIASNSQQPQVFTAPSSRLGTTPQYVWVTEPTLLSPADVRATDGPVTPKVGAKVGDRYVVIAPHIWQDTQPLTSCNPTGYPVSEPIRAYLRLQSYSLHLPTLYGVLPTPCQPQGNSSADHKSFILLLDNVPVDVAGQLLPSIDSCWSKASPVRQVYWLWQILELWHVLSRWGQTASLLASANIRVDGWRIRLVNVWSNDQWRDAGGPPTPFSESQQVIVPGQPSQSLHWYLGRLWQSWVDRGHPALVGPLTRICEQLQSTEFSWARIKQDLNILLLQQAAQQPLRLAIAGGSNGMSNRAGDMCYPCNAAPSSPETIAPKWSLPQKLTSQGSPSQETNTDHSNADQRTSPNVVQDYDVSAEFVAPQPWEELDPYVAILCDGVNNPHEKTTGGAMASQLVARSLKLQLGAFLTEIESHKSISDLITPDVLADQLAAIVRIVNNVLLAQNRSHQVSRSSSRESNGHEHSSSMRTTAALAIQIPQSVTTSQGTRNGHELYVASVGNSRVYWLTPTHCHCLTQDDNVAARNVFSHVGRGQLQERQKEWNACQPPVTQGAVDVPQSYYRGQSYHDIQLQAGASRLTQSLGTKEGEQLTIQVRRLMVDEDGILLLCSHTLSEQVETHWQSITTRILQGQLSLEQAVQLWLGLLAQAPQSDPGNRSYEPHLQEPTAGPQKQGVDAKIDASVVLMRCQVSAPQPLGSSPSPSAEIAESTQVALEIARAQQTVQPMFGDNTHSTTEGTLSPHSELDNAPFPDLDLDEKDIPIEQPFPHPPRRLDWMALWNRLKRPQTESAPEVSGESPLALESLPSISSLENGPDPNPSQDASGDVKDGSIEERVVDQSRPEENRETSENSIEIEEENREVPMADREDISSSQGVSNRASDMTLAAPSTNLPPSNPTNPPPTNPPDLAIREEKPEIEVEESVGQPLRSLSSVQLIGGCLAIMVGAIALGLTTWRYLDPVLFDQVVVRSTEQFLQSLQENYPWLNLSSQSDIPLGGHSPESGERSEEELGE